MCCGGNLLSGGNGRAAAITVVERSVRGRNRSRANEWTTFFNARCAVRPVAARRGPPIRKLRHLLNRSSIPKPYDPAGTFEASRVKPVYLHELTKEFRILFSTNRYAVQIGVVRPCPSPQRGGLSGNSLKLIIGGSSQQIDTEHDQNVRKNTHALTLTNVKSRFAR
jgi:hypothetical protein